MKGNVKSRYQNILVGWIIGMSKNRREIFSGVQAVYVPVVYAICAFRIMCNAITSLINLGSFIRQKIAYAIKLPIC